MRLVLVAAAALIDRNNHILISQRPEGKAMAGLWEFPGGKVEAGETPEAALARELDEELALTVAQADLEPLTFASHTYPDFHLLMPLYLCRRWQGAPQLVDAAAVKFVPVDALTSFAMPEADAPLVEQIHTAFCR